MNDLISRQAAKDALVNYGKFLWDKYHEPFNLAGALDELDNVPSAERKGWNNHEVACLLAELFGDTCACNYNGIDGWLPLYCDFGDVCCPHTDGVACWEQFLKYRGMRGEQDGSNN